MAGRRVADLAADELAVTRLDAARTQARQAVWKAGGAPAAVTDPGGGPLCVDIDATLVTAHSDKESAAPTYKDGFGFHPLLDRYREAGDRHGEGQTLNNLGTALVEVRRFDEAIAAYEQALDRDRETGDRYGEGRTLSNLGTALVEVRRFDEAIAAYEQALDRDREAGDEERAAQVEAELSTLQNRRPSR